MRSRRRGLGDRGAHLGDEGLGREGVGAGGQVSAQRVLLRGVPERADDLGRRVVDALYTSRGWSTISTCPPPLGTQTMQPARTISAGAMPKCSSSMPWRP
jgi:hypothetical protein